MWLVLVCMVIFAAADAALGVGAVLPGETGIVLAAIVLSDSVPHVALGVVAAAVGAFVGDHVGFAVGRRLGPGLGESRLIRRIGRDRWHRASVFVGRRFWVVIIARLMPGIRTLVSAAAGASAMPYRRFAVICALAASLWASIWVVGGAIIGNALLDLAERYTLPALFLAAVGVATAAVIVRKRKVHAQ